MRGSIDICQVVEGIMYLCEVSNVLLCMYVIDFGFELLICCVGGQRYSREKAVVIIDGPDPPE